jgi:hypothetical protein
MWPQGSSAQEPRVSPVEAAPVCPWSQQSWGLGWRSPGWGWHCGRVMSSLDSVTLLPAGGVGGGLPWSGYSAPLCHSPLYSQLCPDREPCGDPASCWCLCKVAPQSGVTAFPRAHSLPWDLPCLLAVAPGLHPSHLICFLLAVLEFKLRALCLLDRHSIT